MTRVLCLRTSGTNCEHETMLAFRLAGAEPDLVRSDVLVREPARLDDYAIVVFPGGFSHGDDISAGRVWGMEARSELGTALKSFAARGGYTLGVCNGFQVLVEAGLFEPEQSPGERSIALYANASNHYECRWVTVEARASAVSWLTAGERMPLPVAHGEGRFVVRDDASWQRLEARRQIALVYVQADGKAPGYPANPNGSVGHVAGICDPSGRVLGLMPHPERNITPWQHPQWSRLGKREVGEGLAFYRRLVEAAAQARLAPSH